MNHEFWYLSRAAGFTAYLLLFASIALGMAMSTRLAAHLKRGNFAFDMHRFLSILALAFSLFHTYILLGDRYFSFNVWSLSLPFISPYRAWAVALGTLSTYLLVLVTVSFYVKKFIGYRAWRSVHFLTFVLYLSATAHGITAGSDTTAPWARLIYAGTSVAVLLMVAYRVHQASPRTDALRRLRLVASSATALAAAVIASVAAAFIGGSLHS
jgi:predicted ferric reductase